MDKLQYFQSGTWVKAAFFPATLATAVLLFMVLLGRGPKTRTLRWIALVSALLAGARTSLTTSAFDFQVFYYAGLDTIQGRNPYQTSHVGVMPFIHPNVLPLCSVMALFDYQTSRWLWGGLNLVFSLLLAPLAWIALAAQDRSWPSLRPELRWALAAFMPMSTAAALTIDLGQLSLWMTVAAFLALVAQASRRPIAAGFCLTLALFKVATGVPILALFLRKSDRITWVVVVVASLVLTFSFRPFTSTIDDIRTASSRIEETTRAGELNDYSLHNPHSPNIIGFNHTLSRLGVGDRRVVGLLHLGLVAIMCGWLAWEVLLGKTLERGALCGLVAIVAVLFMYHRLYDAVILVLPLTYAIGRADSTRGGPRWRYLAAAAFLMVPLLAPGTVMSELYNKVKAYWLINSLYVKIVLTSPTMSIIAAASLLAWAGYSEGNSVKRATAS